MQREEINKVSRLSIFLACSRGVFLGWEGEEEREVEEGGLFFVIHKLC